MTEEEIKKLAEQYAEFTDGSPADKAYIRVIAQCFTEWLSKDYTIVPKVEILNQHAWYMQRMKEVSSNRQMNQGKAIALETLFGKEMFEEDKK